MEQERKKQTEARLLQCGKREFLEKGYAKANLRAICAAAGVTTGAFYCSFASKEALLSAIIEPVMGDFEQMMRTLSRREEEDLSTSEENERLLMQYASAHREEAIILLEGVAGSRYEGFRARLLDWMQEAFRRYYTKHLGQSPDEELIRILADMRLRGSLELIRGEYSMERRLFLTRAIGIHAEAGTEALIEALKNEKNAR